MADQGLSRSERKRRHKAAMAADAAQNGGNKRLRMPPSAFLPLSDRDRLLRGVVSYDGAAFHGFQTQDSATAAPTAATSTRTVQQVLEDALRRTTGEQIRVRAASRTDRGVHARGQVVSFSSKCSVTASSLRDALNSRLPDDVLCRSIEECADEFDPRAGSTGKLYAYSIVNGGLRPVLGRDRIWYIRKPLDTAKMREAAALLTAAPVAKDFSSFAGSTAPMDDGKGAICALSSIEIDVAPDDEEEESDEPADAADRSVRIRILFRGDRFLYKMVRNLVGTLVDVGLGKIEPTAIPMILESKSRAKAGQGAPAHGLTLLRIYYEGESKSTH